MSRSIKISEETYQKIMEKKPEKMSRLEFLDQLVDRAVSSTQILEEMKENQNEILYKLREIWNIIHPAPSYEKEKAMAKTQEERQEIEAAEFKAYIKNITAGREENVDGYVRSTD